MRLCGWYRRRITGCMPRSTGMTCTCSRAPKLSCTTRRVAWTSRWGGATISPDFAGSSSITVHIYFSWLLQGRSYAAWWRLAWWQIIASMQDSEGERSITLLLLLHPLPSGRQTQAIFLESKCGEECTRWRSRGGPGLGALDRLRRDLHGAGTNHWQHYRDVG